MNSVKDEKDIVLYFGPGAFAGIFSVGFAAELEKTDFKKRLYAVYGNSAGAVTGLYYLSNQSDTVFDLYTEDLRDDNYLRWNNVPWYFLVGMCNYLLRTNFRLQPIMDVDLVERCITTHRKVDYETYRSANIPFYSVAYNLNTHHHDFLEIKKEKDIVPVLRATAGAQPAYPFASCIKKGCYIDGAMVTDRRRIERVIGRHPNKQVVCVLSNSKSKLTKWQKTKATVATAFLMLPFFGARVAAKTLSNAYHDIDVDYLRTIYPYVHFIENTMLGHTTTTDPKILKKIYKSGQRAAQKMLRQKPYDKPLGL